MGCGAGGAVHVVPLSCHRVTLLGCWQYQCCAGHDGKGHSERPDTLCTSVMQYYSAWQEISHKETYSTTVQSSWQKYSVAVAWRRVIKHIWPLPHWYENGLALMQPPVEKHCTHYLPAVSTRSPGACESNSAPGVAQAKLISHSTAGVVKNSTERAGMGTGRSKISTRMYRMFASVSE